MLKSNLPQNYISASAGFVPKKRSGKGFFSAKLIFSGIFGVGLAMAGTSTLAQLNNIKQLPNNYVINSQFVPDIADTGKAYPSLLTIPSLQISAPFEFLGIAPNHFIEVPKDNMSVGWFIYGAGPGEAGPLVIVGHLDSAAGGAIFANLNKIKPGDKIFVDSTDGAKVAYRVDSVAEFPQDKFPTDAVYGHVPYPAIRLITCAGTYSKKAGHYSNNLIVFGTKI